MTATHPTAPPAGLFGANLVCLLSMVIWAAGLPAADLITPHMPAVALTAARATLAALVLLPVWWIMEGGQALRQADWLRGTWVGFVMLGLASICLILALLWTDSVTVAIITATMPVAGITLETFADRRPFTRVVALGLVLSVAGGLIALLGGAGGLDLGLGALAALGSVLCYTWGSRATVKALPGMTALGRSALTVTGTAALMIVLALADGVARDAWPAWQAIGLREFAGLAVFGIGSMAASQLLWIWSVGRIGIGAASLHMNAVPFYVMLMVFALGGPWDWWQALGAVVVVTGALVAQGLLRLR
jgi:drug/metabolite transporter (DMT)-like permease